jgi:polyisoprenoid-binding protein YceI
MAFGVIAAALVFTTAHAEVYKFDKAHTNIGFSVRHMTISQVKGHFSDFSGSVDYNDPDPTKSAIELTIQTASISTDNERRDGHLKSPDFFAADSFPTITFKSTKIVSTGTDKYDVTGDLTMRGVTKPVTLSIEITGKIDDKMMGKRFGFTATGKLNRQDWGVSWSHTLDTGGLVAGNEITLLLDGEAAVPREQ